MITGSNAFVERQSWQQQLAQGFSKPAELLEYLALDPCGLTLSQEAQNSFAMRVPRCFADRMEKGNPNDPLLRQVLPLHAETLAKDCFTADPLAETSAILAPGVLKKYHGRVLFTLTTSCAINCRYCFRRHFPYQDHRQSQQVWQQRLALIAEDPSISELILSGGDPLMLSDKVLAPFLQQVANIKHLKRLRIHSRMPVVLPARMTEELLQSLQALPQSVALVIHANHANELDQDVAMALAPFARAGISLLNQSVLLAGINDDLSTLINLSERLFAIGVLPYYLHLADKVSGTAHFVIDDKVAKQLFAGLQAHCPGYLVPRLVREIPGKASKTLVLAD